MTTRTTTRTVTFRHPFLLSNVDYVLPAGEYSVETDEEMLEGPSIVAYRRTLTSIAIRDATMGKQSVPIDPRELEEALAADSEHSSTDHRKEWRGLV